MSTPVEVTMLTEEEWRAAAHDALAMLGVTYAELADQARRWDFVSVEALKLWVAIGGTFPSTGGET